MASSDELRFQVVDANRSWYMPKRGTPQSAGLDLHMDDAVPKIIKGHETEMFNTNLRVYIPEGCYGRIAPRSSLAKLGVLVNAGVIDSDYRGEIKIMLHNVFHTPVYLHGDQPIAQLIIEKLHNFPNGHMVIHDTKILDSTERDENGFGSTNKSVFKQMNGSAYGTFVVGELIPEPKRVKKDPLVGIETNPGPQITSCDSCGKILSGMPPGYREQATLIRYGMDTVYFCNLQCMVNCLFRRGQVKPPQPQLGESGVNTLHIADC